MKSYTLTLTSANTAYKMDDLIKAINTKERSMFGGISIQADSANANPVLVGGSNLSSTVYGQRLAAGERYTEGGGQEFNYSSTLGIYLYGVTTAGMTVHVSLEEK